MSQRYVPLVKIFSGWQTTLLRCDLATPQATYVLRATLAAWLALSIAYFLELEMPYSAASTVLLVINMNHGAVIGKGTWRVIGTLFGVATAFIMMSAFGQMPLLFILSFSAWLGLCVAGMTLLRHFRGSGVVVAGYTVGLATYGAMGHPETTFEHAIGRGSTVVIGVICLSLVTALLSSRGTGKKLTAHLTALVSRASRSIADRLTSAHYSMPMLEVMNEIYSVDDLLALAKAESEDIAQRAAGVRHAMATLFSALIGGPVSGGTHNVALKDMEPVILPLASAWRLASQALDGGAAGVKAAQNILQHARRTLITDMRRMTFSSVRQTAICTIAADRLLEQLDDCLDSLLGLASLYNVHPPRKSVAVRFHRPYGTAISNGLRAMLTMLLAGIFWLESGWNYGDMMLLVLAPYCSLVATMGAPAAGTLAFFKGTLLAIPAAFTCSFIIFPHIDGLPLLLVTLGIFWLPGIYATTHPKYSLVGLAYLVGFNTLAAAGNPIQYSLHDFINYSLAWLLATLFATLTFKLILPRNLMRESQSLQELIRRDALRLLKIECPHPIYWQHLQQHRIAQLGGMLKNDPQEMRDALVNGIASIHLGRELLRLRKIVRMGRLPSDALLITRNGLCFLALRSADPYLCALHARRCARRLSQLSASEYDVQITQAAFSDIYWLIKNNQYYFCGPSCK